MGNIPKVFYRDDSFLDLLAIPVKAMANRPRFVFGFCSQGSHPQGGTLSAGAFASSCCVKFPVAKSIHRLSFSQSVLCGIYMVSQTF